MFGCTDTPVTLEDIRSEFGAKVADLVAEVTRDEPTEVEKEGLSKDEIWLLRSQMLLKEISKMSPEAMQIKLADRLSNIRESERTREQKKRERYRWQTVQILEVIPRDVNEDLWKAINDELDRVAE